MSGLMVWAQAGAAGGIVHWIIVALIVAGVIGIAFIVARQSGIAIPAFVVQIFWVVVAVVIGVVAIKFLAEYL